MTASLDALAWSGALHLARHGEPDKLAALLRGGTAVPDDVRSFLADVVAGTAKPPVRNTRIKVGHETKLILYKLADAEARGISTKAMTKRFIGELAQQTGAKPTVLRRQFSTFLKPQAASWRASLALAKEIREEVAREKAGYTRTIVRDGKKVKVES